MLKPLYSSPMASQSLEEAVSNKIDARDYFHWALTDNYKRAHGFKMKFGLYSVDLSDKKRIPRKSSKIIKKIINDNKASV